MEAMGSLMSKQIGEPDLLSRAALFRGLARGFYYPVSRRPGDDPRNEVLQTLTRQIAVRRGRRPTPLSRALYAARAAWASASMDELEAAYTRLFLTSIGSPLHETAYGDGRRMAGRTTEIADIAGFYSAFGLQPSEQEADLPDHLCSELEFYSILLIKLAYALNRRWLERRRITERALRAFMNDHLGRWVKAFADSLSEQGAPAAYRALARLLVAAVDEECRRLGIRPRLLTGRISGDTMQAEEFVCPHEAGAPETAAAAHV